MADGRVGMWPGVRFLAIASMLIAGAGGASAQKSGPPSSAGGDWIVFSSGRSGGGDIYAIEVASGEIVKVVGTAAPESTPRYDAFRDRLVYTRHDPRGPMLATLGRDLMPDPNGDVSPWWSPDGWRIVYSGARGGREDLFVARPDGTREKRLTDDQEPDRHPSFSPDGNRVVFARRDESGWDLFTLDLRDPAAVPVRLTESGVYVGHPVWSPDGRRIAFDTDVDGQSEIAVLEIESGEVTRLTERGGNDRMPAWSPDGGWIAFAGADSTGNRDIWTVDIAVKRLDRKTEHVDFDGGPVVVPGSALGRD